MILFTLLLDLARLLNPAERGRTDGELIKACRNVFEVANSSSKKQEEAEDLAQLNENIDDQD